MFVHMPVSSPGMPYMTWKLASRSAGGGSRLGQFLEKGTGRLACVNGVQVFSPSVAPNGEVVVALYCFVNDHTVWEWGLLRPHLGMP